MAVCKLFKSETMEKLQLKFNQPFAIDLQKPEWSVKRVQQKQNSGLNLWKWLLPLTGDYALIAFAFMIAWKWQWPAYPVSLLLLGIAQHRIAILAHDGAHGLICRNSALNYFCTQVLCFWPLMIDLNRYKKFHFDHHRHTGNDELDPELHLKQDRYHLPKTKLQLLGCFLRDLCGGSIVEFMEVSYYIGKSSNPFWVMSFPLVSCAVSFWTGHPEFFVLFMLSKPTTFWAVFRLRVYTEHVGVTGTHRIHVNKWQRWLFAPHNTWMHWEHHQHPQVPFWQLPKLRDEYREVPVTQFEELVLNGK